jgi:hypothetical protein
MAIPRQGHEDVGEQQEKYGGNGLSWCSWREGPVRVLIAIVRYRTVGSTVRWIITVFTA